MCDPEHIVDATGVWIFETLVELRTSVARRERDQDQTFESALQKVSGLLNSPLNEIGQKLHDFLTQANRSCRADELDDNALATLAAQVAFIVDRLPHSFEERFQFDSALIKSIGEDWSKNVVISSMVMPRHGSTWGHERLSMPSEDRNRAHVVDVIHMPGPDRLQEVDLLAYPWIIHEMGHYLLLRYDSHFVPIFKEELERIASTLRLASIADRGSAKAKAQKTLEQLVKVWTPSQGQRNWAHELAIDLISLWTCGPAYLACFQDVVERPDINPYEITQTHPPYAVRADALIVGAKRIGLMDFTGNLQRVIEDWRRSQWKKQRDSRFLSLARPELIEACTKTAFSFCESLKLAQCSRAKLDQVPASLAAYNSEDMGLDLLLFAWFVFEKRGKQAYSEWESQVVKDLARRIMQ